MKITGFPTRQIFMCQFLHENVLATIKQHLPIEELRAEARNLFSIDAEIFSRLNGIPSITGIFDGISFQPSALFCFQTIPWGLRTACDTLGLRTLSTAAAPVVEHLGIKTSQAV
jgi:hypothetical protein